MKLLGDDIYIQQGEDFSLDFEITNARGDPYMLLKNLKNPFLAITVSSALYEQRGGFKQTFWLDLNERYTQLTDGRFELKKIKRFINTEALYLPTKEFSVAEVLSQYGVKNGGQIVLDPDSDFDITNYLFFIVDESDNRTYKYVESYKCLYDDVDNDGYNDYDEVKWEEYNCRIVKHFDTRKWSEQQYYYDMKILTGVTVEEYIKGLLTTLSITTPDLPWSDTATDAYIELVSDEEQRAYIRKIYESGAPLMPEYDSKSLILSPTKIFVGVNLQGGSK